MGLYRRGKSGRGLRNLRDKPQGRRVLIAASQGSAALAAKQPSGATERYQEIGAREDAYAEPTDRYGTFQDALRCLLADANFDVPPEPQRDFFEEDGDVN